MKLRPVLTTSPIRVMCELMNSISFLTNPTSLVSWTVVDWTMMSQVATQSEARTPVTAPNSVLNILIMGWTARITRVASPAKDESIGRSPCPISAVTSLMAPLSPFIRFWNEPEVRSASPWASLVLFMIRLSRA